MARATILPMSDSKRYEQFGWDYGVYNPLEQKVVDWYLRWLGRTGGPVLEIACGRGPRVQILRCERKRHRGAS